MIFQYLSELKKHLALIGLLAFAGWVGLLVLIDIFAGSLWSGSDHATDPMPPIPPVAVAPPPAAGPVITPVSPPPPPAPTSPPDEEKAPEALPDSNCLNVEGSVICLE